MSVGLQQPIHQNDRNDRGYDMDDVLSENNPNRSLHKFLFANLLVIWSKNQLLNPTFSETIISPTNVRHLPTLNGERNFEKGGLEDEI